MDEISTMPKRYRMVHRKDKEIDQKKKIDQRSKDSQKTIKDIYPERYPSRMSQFHIIIYNTVRYISRQRASGGF